MSDFLYEGGYAFYVWSATGISIVALGLMVGYTLNAYRKAKRALARFENKA